MTTEAEIPMEQFTSGDYRSAQINDWCASCGVFGILKALQQAFVQLQLSPDRIAVFGGIGCSGKTPYYMGTNGIHTLHGRVLPFASGAKLADPELTVVAVGGDGDGLGIGAGHLINSARHNLDLTYILFNNGVYGLTKGQPAPTLQRGEQTRSMPHAAHSGRLNPLALALAAGYTWIARGYSYAVDELAGLIQQAISHPGLAFIEVLQPCPTYNDLHTREWYEAKDAGDGAPRLYRLDKTSYMGLIPAGITSGEANRIRQNCYAKVLEWGMHIPVGLFLQDLDTPATAHGMHAEKGCSNHLQNAIDAAIKHSSGRSLTDIESCYGDLMIDVYRFATGDDNDQ
jgi:2-oxoglutarate ferredoxin oxidoreductase subunit beta